MTPETAVPAFIRENKCQYANGQPARVLVADRPSGMPPIISMDELGHTHCHYADGKETRGVTTLELIPLAPAAPSGEARAFGETEDERKLWGLFDVVHVVLGGISQGQDLWSLLRMLAACMKSVDPDWVSPTLEPQPPVAQPTASAREWDVEKLIGLIFHADLHSAYRRCGYDKMTTPQRVLWDAACKQYTEWLDKAVSEVPAGDEADKFPRLTSPLEVGDEVTLVNSEVHTITRKNLLGELEGNDSYYRWEESGEIAHAAMDSPAHEIVRHVKAAAPEPPPAVRWFKESDGTRWMIPTSGKGGSLLNVGSTAWDECVIPMSLSDFMECDDYVLNGTIETTSTGEPLPQLPEGVPPLPEPIDQEYLAEMIHKVRSAAGNNQFTIELCGSLAVICKLAIAYVLTKAEAVPLETAPGNP